LVITIEVKLTLSSLDIGTSGRQGALLHEVL
jgi:hypothetical protein